MTPNVNVLDPRDQINEKPTLNSLRSYDKLKLIKKPKALALASISKSTLHLKINDGLFAPPISIGDRAVAFIESEVLAVVAAQIQGNSKSEIRFLVKELVAQRQNLLSEVLS